MEESYKTVEESRKSVENHLQESRIEFDKLKKIKSSFSDRNLREVLELPSYTDVSFILHCKCTCWDVIFARSHMVVISYPHIHTKTHTNTEFAEIR